MNIYDLPDFDKTIYFIEESNDESARDYSNQTGGVACHHPRIKGILHIYSNNDKKLDSFNPDWWYNRVYRENGTLDSKIADNIEFEGITWKKSWDLYKDIKFDRSRSPKRKKNEDFLDFANRENKWLEENIPEYKRANDLNLKLEELISNSPDLITWEKLKEKVEKEINEIKPPDVLKVEIIGEFGEGNQNEEAWVHVLVTYKNKEVKRGIISWDNCD